MAFAPGNGPRATFNRDLVPMKRLGLRVSEDGGKLSKAQLKSIFGIDEQFFDAVPSKLVVPVLSYEYKGWYKHDIEGYLYLLEPIEWVARAKISPHKPMSAYRGEIEGREQTIETSSFAREYKASISLSGGASYAGFSAKAEVSSEITYKKNTEWVHDEIVKWSGTWGEKPIHKIEVTPQLRCRVIKKQEIRCSYWNRDRKELKFKSRGKEDHWNDTRVPADRIREIRDLAFSPLTARNIHQANDPIKYNDMELLPVPQFSNGTLNITTLLTVKQWEDWHIYDEPWVDSAETITLFPEDGPFDPVVTWLPLE